MKGYLKRNVAFIALFAVILVLCASLLCLTVASNAANAAETLDEESTVEIGHITDTHYYPFRFTYTGDVPANTESEDYFYNYIMDKSKKMWL